MRFVFALPVSVAVLLMSSPAFASRCADVEPRELTLYLVNRAKLATSAETILTTEVTRIWQSAGVAVQWRPAPSGESQTVSAGVYIIVVPEAQGLLSDLNGAGEGLAVIRFSNGIAHRHIYVSVGATTRIISRGSVRPPLDKVPVRLAQQRLARALGRAAAHEVGHYLANSPEHAPRGLMRASHRSSDLIDPDLRPFRVELPIDESGSCTK